MDFVRRLLRDAPGAHDATTACWCSRSATSARISRPRSRASKCVWLADQRGRRPGAAASPRERARRSRTLRRMITPARTSRCAAAPRSCSTAPASPSTRREGRPGRPQRRRQVVAVRAARRPAARRRRRRRRAAALAHRRGGAEHARDRATARPTSCWSGDTPLMERAGRSWREAEAADDGHAIADAHLRDRATPARFDARAARAGAAARPGLQASSSSTRRSTASPAAGACGCSWRAR